MPSSTTLSAFAARLTEVQNDFQTQEVMQQMGLAGEASSKDQIAGPLRAWKTGTLARDISGRALSATQAVVGNMVNYAIFVHDGTKWMRARPYIKAGLEELVSSGKATAILQRFGRSLLERLTK
jgi:hypothetical protein